MATKLEFGADRGVVVAVLEASGPGHELGDAEQRFPDLHAAAEPHHEVDSSSERRPISGWSSSPLLVFPTQTGSAYTDTRVATVLEMTTPNAGEYSSRKLLVPSIDPMTSRPT